MALQRAREAAQWVRARPKVRYPIFVTSLLIYILVGPLIPDGSFWDLLFFAVMLTILVVTFPPQLIPSKAFRDSARFNYLALLLVLAGAALITFVIEDSPLSELIGLLVLFLTVLLVS